MPQCNSNASPPRKIALFCRTFFKLRQALCVSLHCFGWSWAYRYSTNFNSDSQGQCRSFISSLSILVVALQLVCNFQIKNPIWLHATGLYTFIRTISKSIQFLQLSQPCVMLLFSLGIVWECRFQMLRSRKRLLLQYFLLSFEWIGLHSSKLTVRSGI